MLTSKVWYLDATFRIINRPFQQLFGIHCFVKSGDHIKQCPVCFIFMTHRRYEDYVAVFTAIRRSLQRMNLERCMLDYEKSTYITIETVFNVERVSIPLYPGN